jgi:hypothetical protein
MQRRWFSTSARDMQDDELDNRHEARRVGGRENFSGAPSTE